MLLPVIIFIVAYAFIALETPLMVDKSATALLLGVAIWVFYVFGGENILTYTGFVENYEFYQTIHPDGNFLDFVSHFELVQHIGRIAEILFFLMGAMTIVETIDHHNGFSIITERITTHSKRRLLWTLTLLTFILSTVLDNLTTTIVMCAILRKLMSVRRERWLFAGIIVIAANAGGALSPIGDVTTIMLWMGGQVTADNLILKTFIPCVVSLLVPLTVVSCRMKGEFERPPANHTAESLRPIPPIVKYSVFILGIGGLLFVPVFKSITNLPPFIGMLCSLAVLWLITARIHYRYSGGSFSVSTILEKIDSSSILFFLGVLLGMAGLQSMGYLGMFAKGLTHVFADNIYSMNICIGIISSVIDNVPLVAGAIGMFPLSEYATDHSFWLFLSYCVGFGGNLLIISSAAGVAAMGIEKIEFIWYLKRFTPWALLGFFAGAGTFILLDVFVF
ncbi:MAG: sodium:proton antiporter NhaD [Bacteroidetes bacterium]|nr:sodium:proton antiporter NhaD [Bacteroidota bacterium]MCL1967995.1 sodium:proton antiporter NhaD [Bacteroidota bacterium]